MDKQRLLIIICVLCLVDAAPYSALAGAGVAEQTPLAVSTATPDQVRIRLDEVPGLSGFTNPLFITTARDGTNRLFVVEQRGRILVRQPDGTVNVFLDISSTAPDPAHRRVQSGGEQGLLGLAFHPQFTSNGLFYIHHTRAGLSNTNDIAEYRADPRNANLGDPDSERVLLRIPQPFSNHNGGSLEFGFYDGLLYVGKGDGGSGDDPFNRAQNRNELLGKILRLDVNRDDFPSDPNRNYGIPPDNPFAGDDGADEVYAVGLRNPYRFSFDRGTGLLYVGDVGQDWREEIDIVTLGGNYGWRAYEGFTPNPTVPGGPPLFPNEVAALRGIALDPITDLGRSLAQSITGGYVYRGSQGSLPVGSYLFGDYITRKVFLFHNGVTTTLIEDTGFNISSFGEDEAGEVYAVGYSNGIVYRVASTSTNLPPMLSSIPNQTIPASQDTITVTLAATDPNGDPITFTATAQSLALVLDTQIGLRTDGGNLWENFFGAGERWLLDRNNSWYFILPNGEFYLWDGSPQATGTLIGTPGATYHTRIELLYNAQLAFDLDLGRGLRTDDGNLWENFFGAGERWLLDRNNNWYFILLNGEFYLWDGSPQATGTLIASLGTNYHDLIRLLYEGDRGQALASLQVVGNDLTIDRDDEFVGSVVVTATASDGELTDSKIFIVTATF
jgi:glucose/arabinose dehydrogenase